LRAMIDLQVPRFEQPYDSACVPTCVSMVLFYHGLRQDPYDACEGIKGYDPLDGASLRSAANFVRRQGFPARVTRRLSLDDLLGILKQDIPLIPSITKFRNEIPHVVVIRGSTEKGFLINDPCDMRRRKIPYGDFVRRWREQECETLIIYPKGWYS